jgi:hypothetical protein
VFNNTIVTQQGARGSNWGIQVPDIGTVTNVRIQNNIVEGFDYAPISAASGSGVSIDYLWLTNNLFFENGNSDAPRYDGIAPGDDTTQDNLVGDPMFYSATDLHLRTGSPGIHAGVSVAGSTVDVEGVPVGSPPNIGAYETVK